MAESDALLARAQQHALAWLDSLDTRPVPARATAEELGAAFGGPLPERGEDAATVLDALVATAEPGLAACPSGRFFGFVIGGTYPVALAADWLTTAWDQNAGMRTLTPAAAAADETVATWLLDLLGLPAGSGVGLVTGGTTANLTCLGAARHAVLDRVGWDVEARGLQGAPTVTVLAGAELHASIELALRYLGLGTARTVAADRQGRIDPDALAAALTGVAADGGGPAIVCLQAGNVHSGAFDPFVDTIAAAHRAGAWVHVDGAFGLWAAAVPALSDLVAGLADADSWATDAHKTLNVPYDCGVAIVRDRAAQRAAFGSGGAYLIRDAAGDPFELVPEMSRRARGFAVWAVLRHLGREGVADLVSRLCRHATALADGARALGAEVLNDVVYTQVCTAWGDDSATDAVTARLLAEGEVWASGSTWQGRRVLRISVSNWSTTDRDVERTLAALARAAGS